MKITSWNRKWSQCLHHDYTLYVGKIVLKSYQPKILSLQLHNYTNSQQTSMSTTKTTTTSTVNPLTHIHKHPR